MAGVALHNVSKRYGRVEALRELSLQVNDGELLSLVGPSGCGKTSALRIIAGLETPNSGRIEIGGRDVSTVRPHERHVALMFQDSSLYSHMTIAKNLDFAMKMRGVPQAQREHRLRIAAAMLRIEGLLDRKPDQLSGGERQRTALGRAMVSEPQCFLLDEPLSNLDPPLRSPLRNEIKALQRKLGATMIYVTHDQEEAMVMGDRVAVMREGRIEQIGTPREIYDEPANVFVAQFFGSPTMNLWRGAIKRIGDQWYVEGGDVRVAVSAEAQRLSDEVLLGVRPHHLRCASESDKCISMIVEAIDHLGDSTVLRGRTPAGLAVNMKTADANRAVGDTLNVQVTRYLLFSAEDSKRYDVPVHAAPVNA